MFTNSLKKVKTRCIVSLLAVSGLISSSLMPAFAGMDMLVDKLAEKGVITYGEAQQIMTESKEDARKELAAGKSSSAPAWVQNIVMSGDMRIRDQVDCNQVANSIIRNRFRVRLRANFDTRLSECFKAGFGFSTGSEGLDLTTDELGKTTQGQGNVIDANSGSANSTFSAFGRLPVELNLAFMEYDPIVCGLNLSATVGKMRQGTQVWNATDLLWEPSMNPDGASLMISKNIAPEMNLSLIGSYLIINQLNSAVSNPSVSIADLVYTWDNENYKVKIGVAQQNLDVMGKNCGQYFGDGSAALTAPANGTFTLSNYGVPLIMNPNGSFSTTSLNYIDMTESFELTYKNLFGSNNVSLIGDMAANSYAFSGANIVDESASCYGVKIGASSVAGLGQWQFVYLTRTLGGNAWLNKLGANDPYGAAHNSTGSQEQLNLGLSKALTAAFTYYAYDKIEGAGPTTPQTIFQSDLIYKF